MRFNTFWTRAAVTLGALLGMAALPASADPIFGPEVYVRTSGSPDVYSDNFNSAFAGTAYMWVLNGDEGGSRVSDGLVVFNGKTVATAADFGKTVAYFVKPVTLLSATPNNVSVTLNSDPGSFITIVIVKAGLPDISVGRLIVPWTSSTNLVLDLKNGSHQHDRILRILVYDNSGTNNAGNVVASSDRKVIGPAGALADTAANLITNGTWTNGSIEIFYAGRGPAR